MEAIRSTYKQLSTILSDPERSYPLVGVSAQYLIREHGFDELNEQSTPPDHVVIAMYSDKDRTAVFDPFMAFSRKKQKLDNGFGKGIVVLPTSQFLADWESATFNSWSFWVEKLVKETRTLSEFGKQQEMRRD